MIGIAIASVFIAAALFSAAIAMVWETYRVLATWNGED